MVATAEATRRAELDVALVILRDRKDAWARLPVTEKIAHLEEAAKRAGALAERWAEESARAKGLPPDSPLLGEELLTGPWALIYALNRYRDSLRAVARGRTPRLPRGTIRTRPDGQVAVRVFPHTLSDRILLNGVSAEVWMEPGVARADLRGTMASVYRRREATGRVALVLGAGNLAAIAPLDLLTKLIGEGQVCLLKLNPVNAYLAPILAEVFGSLIDAGFVQLAQGDAEAGAYLCAHKDVDTIHITGSARTHDAIVYGPGPAGAARKARDEPLIDKPFTSELGNVSPTIVVPGPWEAADLRFQAEQIASQKFHNAGFNCVAAQVLITPGEWDRQAALLDELRATIRRLPDRPAYYPGAAARLAALLAAYPGAEQLSASPASPRYLVADLRPDEAHDACFGAEVFGPALAQTSLPGADAATFLRQATRFCNERLHGTLGVNLLIHPATLRELGPALDEAIAELRYGCVAINAWTGVGFLLGQVPWGAYPGNTRAAIGSGSGVVHNTFLFGRTQKSVVRGPFRPFPRSLLRGERSVLTKPPWFVTNARQASLARKLIAFELDPGARHLPGIFATALRG